MTMTDDELTSLIATRFGDGSLRVDLAQVERRGRQRRHRARIAMAAAALLGLAGATVYGIDRHTESLDVAALDRGCQASYTAEAAKTLRAAQLPTTLGTPLIEMRRGDARFRLYTSAPGPLRAMIFDCARTADGAISGRISYGPTTVVKPQQPLVAYRDRLPDGTVAIVAQLRDPTDAVTVTATRGEVQLARRDGMAVLWGPRDALADAKLTVRDGGLDLARDPLATTATYQEEEFAQYCRRTLDNHKGLAGATLGLTVRHEDTWVLKVYRTSKAFAVCSWTNIADDPDHGLSYFGPALSTVSAGTVALGVTLSANDRDGAGMWTAGVAPAGTESVEIVSSDGTTVRAQVGDGVYLAQVPDDGKVQKIIMTTATTVYTIDQGKVTQRAR
ncbi:hypothetical protein [Catellatospora tritici]|uniref:hypothetical protein n=1 Tax=Catellatospora tritici TaxID=2851566 RepID=UPI001C2D9E0D|nr:hypothetical protein [Catellatospora tritici]MBV1854480.1 hypothetical protein [Catellatospora tritici]